MGVVSRLGGVKVPHWGGGISSPRHALLDFHGRKGPDAAASSHKGQLMKCRLCDDPAATLLRDTSAECCGRSVRREGEE